MVQTDPLSKNFILPDSKRLQGYLYQKGFFIKQLLLADWNTEERFIRLIY